MDYNRNLSSKYFRFQPIKNISIKSNDNNITVIRNNKKVEFDYPDILIEYKKYETSPQKTNINK